MKIDKNEFAKRLSNLLDKKISIKRVGALGAALVLAGSLGVGKLKLETKSIIGKYTTEISLLTEQLEISKEMDEKTQEIMLLLNQKVSQLEDELSVAVSENESLVSENESLVSKNENLVSENESLANELNDVEKALYDEKMEASVAIANDMNNQFNYNALTIFDNQNNFNYVATLNPTVNGYSIGYEPWDFSTDSCRLVEGINDLPGSIENYSFMDISLPEPIIISRKDFKSGINRPYRRIADINMIDDGENVEIHGFRVFMNDFATLDKEKNIIYFTSLLNDTIGSWIYSEYLSQFSSDEKAKELTGKALSSISFIELMTAKDYCEKNNVEPTVIPLNDGKSYTNNFVNNTLISKILENSDVLVQICGVANYENIGVCDYCVGKRTYAKDYNIQFLDQSFEETMDTKDGGTRGL